MEVKMRVSVVWSSGGEGGVEEWTSGAALLPPSLSERLGPSAGVCGWRQPPGLRRTQEAKGVEECGELLCLCGLHTKDARRLRSAAFNMPWCEVEAHDEDTLQRQHHARSHARVS